MEEEILAVAKCVTGIQEQEEDYLSTLCAMERGRLEKRLKEPLTTENRSAFICAAAWMAAADYFGGKSGTGAASWSAGDVKVQEKDASAWNAASENLRRAAKTLMEEHLEDEGFSFLGVRG